MVMKSTIFWDIAPCSPLSANRRACHLLSRRFLAHIIFSTLKMEAICSSETSFDTQRTTRRYRPEDGIFRDELHVPIQENNFIKCWSANASFSSYSSEMMHLKEVLKMSSMRLNTCLGMSYRGLSDGFKYPGQVTDRLAGVHNVHVVSNATSIHCRMHSLRFDHEKFTESFVGECTRPHIAITPLACHSSADGRCTSCCRGVLLY
jgi:hypothetical protein